MSIAPKAEQDRNQEATVYLGNLDDRVSDALIWELMLQAGPVSNVFLPKDRISMSHQGFGFCEFLSEQDSDYAVKIMNQIKLYGKPIRVNKASYDRKQVDVGANLFIGSLDESADEAQLYETFSTFGHIADQPKIARDPSTGQSKGYGFVSYHEFEAADMAIENMNGQFFGGKQISVQFAFKKDGKGERHGSQAERLLAAQAKKRSMLPGQGMGMAPTIAFQGHFAGALAPPQARSAATGQPPAPPPGMPVYQPPQYGGQQQAPPPGYPPQMQYDYGQQQQQQAQNGYGGEYYAQAPPPPGFPVANGYQQQGQFAPPPPPAGFGGQGQAQYGAPPGAQPLRMGFEGQ